MTLKITGGAELDKFLAQFPLNIQRKALRNGLRRGANVIRDEARRRVAKKSGKTAKSIKSSTKMKNGVPIARVNLRGPHSYIGRFLEYGVAAHYLSGGDSGLSARKLTQKMGREGVLKIGSNFVSGAILHPGFAPEPFLRPALDARQAAAVNAVGAYISDWLRVGDMRAPLIEADDG